MTLHNFQNDERFLASSTEILQRLGITITTGTDFAEYRDLLALARPDQTIGAPFDPDLHRLDAANAFWMLGHDNEGKLMHTQAMRVLDTRTRSLGEYMRHGFRDFPPAVDGLDLERSRYRAGPGAQRMTGCIAYHGEFWIGGTPGQFRGSGLSSILGRYAFLEALHRWDPDYVFGFMQRSVAFKGFAERHGYMHSEPGALRWFLKGNDTPIEGFMVYMQREDLHYILDMPLAELVPMAA